MLIRPRVIPCLLIERGNLVKSRKFKKSRYLGDPINAVKIYNEKNVDEIVLLDILATQEKVRPNFEILKEIASEAFMPLSYGGGIHSLEDAKKIFKIGFEKIILNSALIENPEVVTEIIKYFGNQSVVASIDFKKNLWGKTKCYTRKGKKETKWMPVEFAKFVENLGVGEILLNDIERDGMRCGYNIEVIRNVSDAVKIPVTSCGGADNIKDLNLALKEGHASAVAAGSMFVFYGKKNAVLINFPSEEELIKEGVYYYE